jgi:hypothetical protein
VLVDREKLLAGRARVVAAATDDQRRQDDQGRQPGRLGRIESSLRPTSYSQTAPVDPEDRRSAPLRA